MADVMHTIASIFSRPATSWGFGSIDKSEDVPVKIEDDVEESKDVLMTNDDGSDSDIEIVDVVKLPPHPQNRLRPNTTSSCPFSSDRRSKERIGRKREESVVDLARDESQKKKIKTDNEEEKKTTSSFLTNDAIFSNDRPATSPKQRPTTTSRDLVKTLENSLKKEEIRTDKARTHRSLDNGSKTTELQKSSAVPSPVTSTAAPATKRRRMLFEEDDEDDAEEEDGKPLELLGSRPKPAPMSSIFSRMWSEPNSSKSGLAASAAELSKQGHAQIETEKPTNRSDVAVSPRRDEKAPIKSDAITYQPFRPTRPSEKPISKPGPPMLRSDKNKQIGTNSGNFDFSSNMPRSRLGGSLGVEVPPWENSSTNHGLSDSKPSNEQLGGRLSEYLNLTNPLSDSRRKAADTEQEIHQLTSQEISRKRQEELMAKYKPNDAPKRSNEGNIVDKAQTEDRTTATVPTEGRGVTSTPNTHTQVLPGPEQVRQREQAANARKQADLRRAREAQQRAQEKADAERRAWEERRKLMEAQREQQRRRQSQAQNEADTMSERTEALSKLSEVKKTSKTNDCINKVDHESKVSSGTLLNNVSAQPGTKPSTRLFEIQDRQARRPVAANQPSSSLQPISSMIGEMKLPTQSTSTKQVDESNADRTQQREENNDRRRMTEKEREQKQPNAAPTSATQSTSVFQPLPMGPVSLSSSAGQTLLAHSDVNTPRSRIEPGRPLTNQSPNSQGNLGEILPQDIDLVKWRDSGVRYREIDKLFERKYKQHKAEGSLQNRFKQVSEALKDKSISDTLRKSAYAGSEEARQEVNRILHGSWPLPNAATPSTLPKFGRRLASKHGPRSPSLHSVSNERQPMRSPPPPCDFGISIGSPVPEVSQHKTDGLLRPHTSGKTMDENAFHYYLEGLREVWEEEAGEEKARREPTPFTADDYAPFAYQVERRELKQEAIEEGENIEDMGLVRCGEPFDNLRDANKEAIKQIFRGPKGQAPSIDTRYGFEHKTEINDGMDSHELRGKHGGVRQVQVTRFMQTFQHGILPQNKDGWAERTAFIVKQRTVKQSKDDMFDEVGERTFETDVDSKLYTTLDLANDAAIKKFVERTFTPKSGHLTHRQIEIQDAKQQLLDELDEYGMFHKSIEDDKGEMTVDIWVEEAELVGPRNLY